MRTIEPTQITQGERIEWTISFGDYPATLYTLQYRIRHSGTENGIDVDATADGTDFNNVITAAASAELKGIGRHRWQGWLTEIADTTNTFLARSGFVNVNAGFVTADLSSVDTRSTAKQILDALDSAILNTASVTQMEYEITTPAGSRRIKNMSRTEQMSQRKIYAGIVARENAAERVRNGGSFGKRVVINMRER